MCHDRGQPAVHRIGRGLAVGNPSDILLELCTVPSGQYLALIIEKTGAYVRIRGELVNKRSCRGWSTLLQHADDGGSIVFRRILEAAMPARGYTMRLQRKGQNQGEARKNHGCPEPEEDFDKETGHTQ